MGAAERHVPVVGRGLGGLSDYGSRLRELSRDLRARSGKRDSLVDEFLTLSVGVRRVVWSYRIRGA